MRPHTRPALALMFTAAALCAAQSLPQPPAPEVETASTPSAAATTRGNPSALTVEERNLLRQWFLELRQQTLQRRRPTLAPGTRVGVAAATPGPADNSLSVSDDVSLSAGSNLYKNGELLLWDDGTAGMNLALGLRALASNTTGEGNTATGLRSLQLNATGTGNTGLGSDALQYSVGGSDNTAVGRSAMQGYPFMGYDVIVHDNVAVGAYAFDVVYAGSRNTAVGARALTGPFQSFDNTAVGAEALQATYSVSPLPGGTRNVAVGSRTMSANLSGFDDTAVGFKALTTSTQGGRNTALGALALAQAGLVGYDNTAVGFKAGYAVGDLKNYNIHIGAFVVGSATDSYTIRLGNVQTDTFIAGIHGQAAGPAADIVYAGTDDKLGTLVPSTRRVKTDIEDLGERSRRLLDLRPVSFRYRETQEDESPRSWGLIAEQVAEVFPELVRWDDEGAPASVRYHQLITLLLNELQRHEVELGRLRHELSTLRSAVASDWTGQDAKR